MRSLLFCLLLIPMYVWSQHSIQGTFPVAKKYKFVILYQVTPTGLSYTADTNIEEDGSFQLQLDENAAKGVYQLVYSLPQEEFNFELFYNGEEDISFQFTEAEGVSFTASEENQQWRTYFENYQAIQKEISELYKAETPNKEKIMAAFKRLSTLHNRAEQESEGMLANHFIKAFKFYIPKKFESQEVYGQKVIDHFLDAIDFNDTVIQGTSFLSDLAFGYLIVSSKFLNELYDYQAPADTLVAKMDGADPEFKKQLLFDIWQQLSISEAFLPAANYIATTHLIPLAKQTNDTQLANQLFTFTSLSIGSTAPNFSWETSEMGQKTTQQLHELDKAETYVLVFWSSSCSHCLQEIPILHNYLSVLNDSNLKVLAIGLEEDAEAWQQATDSLPNFTNVLGLNKWDNEIGNLYNISATPTYFVLDEDKTIVSKPDTLESLLKIITPEK